MKCGYCANYMSELDRCKFCHFEYKESVIKDDWDIFNLDEDDGWEHKQLLNRLHSKNVNCISADIYFDNNIAFLIGCYATSQKIANALNLNVESVYGNNDSGLVILNLHKEKAMRLGIDVDKEWGDGE